MIKVNEYFDGGVKSLGYENDGSKSSLGVMEEGEYEFGTSMHEVMTVVEGELIAKLPGSDQWVSYTAGKSFEVDANVSFKVKSVGRTAYLCQYS